MDNFIKFLQVVVTGIVGYYAFRIANEQRRIAHNKLRLDLYDRRYKVFRATWDFWFLLVSGAGVDTDKEYNDFVLATGEAQFLFDPEVEDCLANFRRRLFEIRQQEEQIAKLPLGPIRSAASTALSQNVQWLKDQFPELLKVFNPYLKFQGIDVANAPSALDRLLRNLFGEAEK